jgi:hypothetical protein
MVRACSSDAEANMYRILVGRPFGKWPLGRLRSRWEDNMNMDLSKMYWRMGGGWNWLRIMPNNIIWNYGVGY